MTKVIKGSCNWCGSCCGFGPYPKPAFPYALWKWDKQHPDLGLPLVKLIKSEIGEDTANLSGSINIAGVGRIDFYLSEDGLQTSETDNTCPFFDQGGHTCRIWDSPYLPQICRDTPQNISGDKTDKWAQDHPDCGFYWEEE